ncbi:hypothetical protein Rs2_04820 [Raphanus sativus]|nr:hypothetical protein Rs2_04820 [Raphanus sativus]
MSSHECAPNTITHNIVMSGLVKSGNVDEALDLYYDLISDGDFSPTPCTYGPLIDGLSKSGRLYEAKQLFEGMLDYGCRPNCAIYNILINGFGKAGEADAACKCSKGWLKKV